MVSSLGNTTAMLTPAILSEIKLDFQVKIKRAGEDYNIPDDLIINFGQTLLAYSCYPLRHFTSTRNCRHKWE